MMMNNAMMQELNDTRLDMVNGGGFLDKMKEAASELWQAAKNTVEALEITSRIRDEL